MIADNLAKPIADTAAKAFSKTYDPNKPTLHVIFHDMWDPFLRFCEDNHYMIRQTIRNEVDRMIA